MSKFKRDDKVLVEVNLSDDVDKSDWQILRGEIVAVQTRPKRKGWPWNRRTINETRYAVATNKGIFAAHLDDLFGADDSQKGLKE